MIETRRPLRAVGRALIAGAGLLSLVLLLLGCSEESGQAAAARSQQAAPLVSVAKPVVRQIVEDDEFVGRFEATDTVQLRSRVDGYLSAVHFTDGMLVQNGDLLFTIDQRPFKTAIREAEAELNSAQAVLAFTRDDLERARQLSSRGNISQQTLDERRQQYQVAQARLAAAEAALARAQLDLEYTEIRAPISGRIDEKRVSEGNLVEANATILTTIVSLDPIYFYFDIDERSFLAYARDARARGSTMQEGAGSIAVTVHLADEREPPRQGRLDFSENRLDQATGTMRVRAILDNADKVLQPGLFGRINVPGSLPYRGILIPDEAIASDQQRRIVYVIDDEGVVSTKEIRPGPRIDGYRVVREGLTGDETIVVNGLLRVRPGITVTPQLAELPPTRS
ncbi:MAG: efflux RND transporter periplasmic adaptor subunit [Kiloniellales bacterium]